MSEYAAIKEEVKSLFSKETLEREDVMFTACETKFGMGRYGYHEKPEVLSGKTILKENKNVG